MPVKPFITATLFGGAELADALDQLPKSMTKPVLRAAGRKALAPVRDAAAAAAQSAGFKHSTGKYASSFVIGVLNKNQRRNAKKKGGKDGIDLFVGSTDRKAALLEFGHLTRPKNGVKGVVHVKAFPILRPVWDANREEVLKIFGEELWNELQKKAKSLAKRALTGKLNRKLTKELYLK